jgi:crotonobetainyl-CoA:carnitine CoA-transferase CaiB-like acyl-CoA transferase
MWAAISVLAALRDRVKTGKGSTVETSLVEAALFWWDGVFAQYVANGRSPRRPGNGSAQIVPYGVFLTANWPIVLGLAGDGCSRHSQSSSVEANGSMTSASQRTPGGSQTGVF